MSAKADAREVNEVLKLAQLIRPILTGHPPERQGAVIAELLATWLACHFAPSADAIDRKATDEIRESMLKLTIECVRKLIPGEEDYLLETKEGRKIWSNP